MGYWQERQEAMYKAGEMQVNKYFTRLEKAFNQTRRELQKTIEAFCFRYAKENGLSFAAAQKKLDAEELGELQDFIDLAMANIGRYNQMVNNMSIKARITRYQALEAQVDAILRQLYAIVYEADAEKTMQEIIEKLSGDLEQKGFEVVAENSVPGNLAMTRKQEIYACLNRYRKMLIRK